jgi:outer membrane protein assembly factor BamC
MPPGHLPLPLPVVTVPSWPSLLLLQLLLLLPHRHLLPSLLLPHLPPQPRPAQPAQPRPAQPGAPAQQPAAPAAPAKARVATVPATAAMEIDEGFDRAWRQVGLALDRSGFTVEDRDRSAGIYFVRYVDPKQAGKDEPNFFSKLFGGDKDTARPQRVRVLVKASGAKTQVTVQSADGNPDNSLQARTIVGKLIDELK